MKKLVLALFLGAAPFSFGQMTMISTATMTSPGDCNCYDMHLVGTNKKGAIWSPVPIDLTQSFDMTFQIFAGTNDAEADGMAFVLQQNSVGIGDVGNGLGYRDAPPSGPSPISVKSLAIEVDLWNSNPTVVTDILSDHIGIESNNSNEHNLGGPYPVVDLEDGAFHVFRVIWDPTLQIMSVVLDGNFIFAYNADIITDIFTGNPTVYFGWTAASGGAIGLHKVCMFRNADFNSDLTSVCPNLPVSFTDNSISDLNNILNYTWDFGDGSPLDISQNPSHTYTTPGTYTAKLYMTDVSGCDDSAEVVITVLPDLIIDVVGTDPACFGDVDGQATATPQNGTGPYLYTWDDPLIQTTQTATNLAPTTTYTVDVIDDLGCIGSGTVTINEPLEMIVEIHQTTTVSCFGGSDGTATAVPINGTAPYNYSWNDPSTQTVDVATGLSAGTYTVTVTDVNGCSAIDSADVLEPTEIFITGVVTYDSGTSNGAIDVTITGGTTPYATTIWSNSATTEDVSGLAAGNYTITVTDMAGCTKDTTFSVKSSVGIGEESVNAFDIYPNPTNGLFQIKGNGYYDILITDVAGKIVLVDNATGNHAIDMSFVESGVYFIQLFQDGFKHTTRLVVH